MEGIGEKDLVTINCPEIADLACSGLIRHACIEKSSYQ